MFSLMIALLISHPAQADSLQLPASIQEKWAEAREGSQTVLAQAQHKIVETRVALLGEGARRSIFHTLQELLANAVHKAKKVGRAGLLSLAALLEERNSSSTR